MHVRAWGPWPIWLTPSGFGRNKVRGSDDLSGILDQRTSTLRLRTGALSAALICVVTAFMLHGADRPLAVVTPFIPIYETTVIMVEGLTAFFLFIQFRAIRQPYLGGLAGAYGFVMVMAICQLLIFPGIFSKTGLLGAGPQSAVWLWVIWHAGFPVMVALALLTRLNAARRFKSAAYPLAAALVGAGPALAVLAAYASIHAQTLLPPLIVQSSYLFLRESLTSKIVVTSIVAAIILTVYITRLRDPLSLWVAIALLASLGDVLLVLAGGARYSLGWYGGRVLSVISSSVVLCALIAEFSRAYANLVTANAALAERAMRDGLTHAFNRFYFEEQYRREWRRAVREGAPMSLLMIDVDHFKAYNDNSGHQVGDECLIAIVDVLQSALRRPGDFIARYGGEEFVVVLPRTGAAGAIWQAEWMRQAVTDLALSRNDDTGGVVSISVGIATIDPALDEVGPEGLLHRADLALYKAKNAGRNRVVVFTSSPQKAHAAE